MLNLRKLFTTILPAAVFCAFLLGNSRAEDLEMVVDVGGRTQPMPMLFRPSVDLSGRGFALKKGWPANLAAQEVFEVWKQQIGLNGIYRLQLNLWELGELGNDQEAYDKALANYEGILKAVTESRGTVILSIFGTPAGMGKILDKKSPPVDLRAYKEVVKHYMRLFSCRNRYNVWYEVWSAPDLDNFFLGRRQDYLSIYRVIAEAVKELEMEHHVKIHLGGPASSWWFQNFNGNTIVAPEESLIYELIRYCYHYRLPLDFISWHAFSTDPMTEKDATIYRKNCTALIRAWLSYYRFDQRMPLVIDEWNFDNGTNVIAERQEKANIAASYIPARLKYMLEADIDRQVYFSLEDFKNNSENVNSNGGVFRFESSASQYQGSPKNIYNVFRMFAKLGKRIYTAPKIDDPYIGGWAGTDGESLQVLLYSYADPDAAKNYLSRGIGLLGSSERKILLQLNSSGRLQKIIDGVLDLKRLKATRRLKNWLVKAAELDVEVKEYAASPRMVLLKVRGLKDDQLMQVYKVNSACSMNCQFEPIEEKIISPIEGILQQAFSLEPYSVTLIVIKNKPQVEKP